MWNSAIKGLSRTIFQVSDSLVIPWSSALSSCEDLYGILVAC